MLAALSVLFIRRFNFQFKNIWPPLEILKGALPFGITVLLMCFHARIDGFLLERISGPTEAGKYAGAYRLLEASNMAGYLVASFLLPFVAKNQHNTLITANVVLSTRHILLVFATSLSMVVILLASWIQKTLYHHNEPGYADVLQWCIPALIGYSIIQIYGTAMTATGHIIPFIYITLASVVANIVLNIALIPSYGAKGSCWSALCSQYFSGAATIWYCRQKLQIPYELRSLLIYIFIAGLVAVLLYTGRDQLISNWILIGIAIILVGGMMWLTKLIDIRIWKVSIRQ
jgi:O-antigen/teichoic acid export membrane protein